MNIFSQNEEQKHQTIVKLRTEYYKDSRSAYVKKVLTTLKRKSVGYDLLLEDIDNIDAEYVLSGITNLYDVQDGIYELQTINHSRDWETDNLQDWDYILKEYNTKNVSND